MKTHVFWDVEDFPLPEGRDLEWFRGIIKEAMKKLGFSEDFSTLKAFGKEKPEEELRSYTDAGFTFQVIGDKYWRTTQMVIDMSRLALHGNNRYEPSNFFIIAKDTSDAKSHFFNALRDMTAVHHNTILVLPDDCLSGSAPTPCVRAAWFWESLLSHRLDIPVDMLIKLESRVCATSPPSSTSGPTSP